MLTYKGQVIHDRCSCCTNISDARPSSADPSGTHSLRRSMRAAMVVRLNRLRSILKTQIRDNDMLGLRPTSPSSAMMAAAMVTAGPSRIMAFQQFVDATLTSVVLESDGRYLTNYVRRAYDRGRKFASSNLTPEERARGQASDERVETLRQLIFTELQGICEAVSQNLVRVAADGILSKEFPNRIIRSMNLRMERVGTVRMGQLADFAVLRSFNEASLDSYEFAGISEVGLIPEFRRPRLRDGLTTDRTAKPKRRTRRFDPNTGPGSRTSRTVVPSRETVRRIRMAQEGIEKLKRVNVLTAGDDDVCPLCEDIAEEGPYRINTARSLIPAHPHAVLEGSTIVSYGPMHEMVRSRFSGPAIRIWTTSGVTTIGPHHPMLTRRGWKKAHRLTKSDELIYDRRIDGSGDPMKTNLEQMPFVEDAFSAASHVDAVRRFSTGHNLHGDIEFCQGEIHVVLSAGLLLPVLDPCGIEKFSEMNFVWSDVKSLLKSFLGLSKSYAHRSLGSPNRVVSRGRLCYAHGGGHSAPLDPFLFRLTSNASTPLLQSMSDHVTTDPVFPLEMYESGSLDVFVKNTFGDRRSTLPVFSFDPVLAVEHIQFSGWAFDASTSTGLYNSDGYVVHNCRCVFTPARDRRFATEDR